MSSLRTRRSRVSCARRSGRVPIRIFVRTYVFELGCDRGEDALYFARHGVRASL
jgi:hypothetical protein